MRYLILLCLLLPFHTFAETSLWKVSKGNSELFIGGTIHVLSAKDYPLPIEFPQAYQQSQRIVFETDMDAMATPEIQQQLLQRMIYQQGKTLRDEITEETYKALSDYLSSVGLSVEMFNQFKPSMIVMTLLMTELQRLGMADTGVDKYFKNLAVEDAKAIGMLETVGTQLDVLENLGKGQENEMILSTIEEMKELPLLMGEMKQAWRTGNINSLEKIGISPMKINYPDLYRLLIVNRNNAWLPKIEALLLTPEVEFILVGALHLVGQESVIAQLKQLGYRVDKFETSHVK